MPRLTPVSLYIHLHPDLAAFKFGDSIHLQHIVFMLLLTYQRQFRILRYPESKFLSITAKGKTPPAVLAGPVLASAG